jgi:hypothetical protein
MSAPEGHASVGVGFGFWTRRSPDESQVASEKRQKFAYIRRGDVMVEVPGQLSQYFFNAAVKVLKFAAGQEVGELSRTSQCMWFAQTSLSRSAVTM